MKSEILVYVPLFFLLLRLAPVTSLVAAPKARQCLDDAFVSKADLLSPVRIVEMIPAPSDVSGSSSRREGSPAKKPYNYQNSRPLRQQLFSSPLTSVLYERVLPPLWAAGLRVGGPDAEYRAAAAYLNGGGGVALDLSCGTGFVGIRMAKSGRYEHVFALDYSRQMLNECREAVKREHEPQDLPLSIIRGDAAALPFRDNSVDCVHWGAAMHCVPDAEASMKEVYRVLKPGGKLYATTFLRPFPDIVFRFFDLDELEDITAAAGFGRRDGGTLDVEGKGVYGIVRATKGTKSTVMVAAVGDDKRSEDDPSRRRAMRKALSLIAAGSLAGYDSGRIEPQSVEAAEPPQSNQSSSAAHQPGEECDEKCQEDRKRRIEERRAIFRQSRTTTSRDEMFELSRQRAKLYGAEYKGARCPEGIPCL